MPAIEGDPIGIPSIGIDIAVELAGPAKDAANDIEKTTAIPAVRTQRDRRTWSCPARPDPKANDIDLL